MQIYSKCGVYSQLNMIDSIEEILVSRNRLFENKFYCYF